VIRSFSTPTDATKSPLNSLNIRAQVRRYVTHVSPIVGRCNQFAGVSFLR
jgi:hypothetical protein